jgi:hypothetical protein
MINQPSAVLKGRLSTHESVLAARRPSLSRPLGKADPQSSLALRARLLDADSGFDFLLAAAMG